MFKHRGISDNKSISTIYGGVTMYTTKLNKSTQKAESWIKQYYASSCFSVRDFYGRCSDEKIRIERIIKERIYNNNLCDYRVLNGNSFYFTVGYRDEVGNTLYIETAYNIFEIDLR